MTDTTSHEFHPSVLREYDIRGIVGKTLGPKDATAIGRAYGTMVLEKGGDTIALGYDGRLSSETLAAALAEGLISTGVHVKRIGLGPTPMLYFAIPHLGAAAGIMVTGSHNPPDHNGFKMALVSGPVYGDAIQAIGKIAAGGVYASGQGSIEDIDIRQPYTERLLKDYVGKKPLKIVWDAGNGATGEILRRLTAKLPGEHILLFDEIDGRFPNHHPDPTVPENLVDLQKAVAQHHADLGIGFDGDGDRIGAIDGTGRIVWGDQLLAIYSREVLATHPGAMIIADVKASQILFDEVARLGGKPLMWKTGHSLIKAKMAGDRRTAGGRTTVRPHIFRRQMVRLRRRAVLRRPAGVFGQPGRPIAGLDRRYAAQGSQHARNPVRCRRGLQIRGDRRDQGPAGEDPRHEGQRHRRGARHDAGRLVADPRVVLAGGSGRPRRSVERGRFRSG